MRIIRSYTSLLCAVILLSGFSWNFGSDTCNQAIEIAEKLSTTTDDTQLRQAEAKIISLCPDGAAANFVTALQQERIGNIEGAISGYRKALQQKSPFPQASGNLGLLYAQKGMNDQAAVELTRGISSTKVDPRFSKALGRVMTEFKVYGLAEYHLNEAARVSGGDAGIYTALADIHAATGKLEKALEGYRRALEADGNHDKAYMGIASVYMKRNEPNKALEELKKAEQSNPQNRKIHLMMASIYELKGDTKQAEYEYLLGGKGKTDQAPLVVKKSAVAAPTVFKGDLDKTIEPLKEATSQSPDKALAAYEKMGDTYRAAGKDDDAIAAYKEAAYRNSTNSEVYLNLGKLYEKRGKLDEAVVAYKQALKTNTKNDEACLRLADIYLARGSYQQAVLQYGEFLRIKPDSPDIQMKLARILARNKETNLAIEAYNAVLKSSPDNIDANREIAPLYKAKGMNDKAVEHLKKALAQQKDDVETRASLVSLYVKNKQYDEVTELLKGTAEIYPDDPTNHYKLGLIYEFRKDYENAIASYKKATALKADHARSLTALGRLYMKTGRIAEAKESLEAAKKADPTLEETNILLNNIRDNFNPEPRKINKKLKGSRNKKTKKGAKSKKSKKSKKTKKSSGASKTSKSKPASQKTGG